MGSPLLMSLTALLVVALVLLQQPAPATGGTGPGTESKTQQAEKTESEKSAETSGGTSNTGNTNTKNDSSSTATDLPGVDGKSTTPASNEQPTEKTGSGAAGSEGGDSLTTPGSKTGNDTDSAGEKPAAGNATADGNATANASTSSPAASGADARYVTAAAPLMLAGLIAILGALY